ncbi:hypothetical protein D3C78_994530 [compost metagenome]
MREHPQAKALGAGQAVGGRRFHLPPWHREDGATEGFGEIRPVDETQGDDPGAERVDLDIVPTQGFGQAGQPGLQGVENQQHQHQVWHPANQRGVGLCRNAQQCKF